MKEIKYRDFSDFLHKKNWAKDKPNLCHFELTYKCNFNCKYCFTACQNKKEFIKRELNTRQVKYILDKVYDAGALWLCLTGGDPFTRKDFFQIYGYVKKKGFIFSVLTNGSFINDDNIAYFRDYPPFSFEITLNSIRENTFEEISGVKGSFKKVMRAIELLSKNKINFKLKTMVIRDNMSQMPEIKAFVESFGIIFRPSAHIHPRLNRDKSVCNLRLNPKEVVEFESNSVFPKLVPEDCLLGKPTQDKTIENKSIFHCGAGTTDQALISPYGEMFLCLSLREPKVDILTGSIQDAFKHFSRAAKRSYKTQSRCRRCLLWKDCFSCPGKAFLETADPEAPADWYCELTHLVYANRQSAEVA